MPSTLCVMVLGYLLVQIIIPTRGAQQRKFAKQLTPCYIAGSDILEAAVREIRAGATVRVTTADGKRLRRIAVTGPVDGDDFRVVWVCKPDDWPEVGGVVSSDMTMAWPVESVVAE